MKTIFSICALALTTIATAQVQTQRPIQNHANWVQKKHGVKNHRKAMAQQLQLTDRQIAEIKDINAAKRAEIKMVKMRHNGEINKVLTPEQRIKREAWKAERKRKAAQRL